MAGDLRQGSEFAQTEYHEAANAYFKGVDIGYTTLRNYITINVLFAALIGSVSERLSTTIGSSGDLIQIVPWLAIAASLALLFSLPYYFRHLENCRKRCEEIELEFGGKLFTRLGGIGRRARWGFNTVLGLMMIIAVVSSFWLYLLVKSENPDFRLFDWLGRLFG